LSDDDVKVKVFASDDNLKALGELLSNDSSRNIIFNLMTKEMYTNEIATKLDMRVSLVIHHLKKLEDLGLLEISEKRIKRKGIDHRFFKIKSNIFVVIDKEKKEIEEQGLLSRIFRDTIKFSCIGLLSVMTYFLTLSKPGEIVFMHYNEINLTYPLLVILVSLIVVKIFSLIKKRMGFRIIRKLFH